MLFKLTDSFGVDECIACINVDRVVAIGDRLSNCFGSIPISNAVEADHDLFGKVMAVGVIRTDATAVDIDTEVEGIGLTFGVAGSTRVSVSVDAEISRTILEEVG